MNPMLNELAHLESPHAPLAYELVGETGLVRTLRSGSDACVSAREFADGAERAQWLARRLGYARERFSLKRLLAGDVAAPERDPRLAQLCEQLEADWFPEGHGLRALALRDIDPQLALALA